MQTKAGGPHCHACSTPLLSASDPLQAHLYNHPGEEDEKPPSMCPFFLAIAFESIDLGQTGHIWQMFRSSALQLKNLLLETLPPRAREVDQSEAGWTQRGSAVGQLQPLRDVTA